VLDLLAQLGACHGVDVDIVSGRPYHNLETWLGHLPVALWAEHGFWHRQRAGTAWQPAASIAPQWMARIRPILDQFTASTPGAHVEVKTASLAWHYRGAQREFGARQAHELRMLLGDTLSNQPLEVLEGKKVIEVRVRGVTKAVVAHRIQAEALANTMVIAIGDDRTDEELFRTLPESSVTVAVGKGPTAARFRVDDYRAVREVLRTIVRNRTLTDLAGVVNTSGSRTAPVGTGQDVDAHAESQATHRDVRSVPR
jgi:trehalose 6-phosphate synthase/phosphatase